MAKIPLFDDRAPAARNALALPREWNIAFAKKLEQSYITKILDPNMIIYLKEGDIQKFWKQALANFLDRYPKDPKYVRLHYRVDLINTFVRNDFAAEEKRLIYMLKDNLLRYPSDTSTAAGKSIHGCDKAITCLANVYEGLGKFDEAMQCHLVRFLSLGSSLIYYNSSWMYNAVSILIDMARLKRKVGDYAASIQLQKDAAELFVILSDEKRHSRVESAKGFATLAKMANPTTYLFDFALEEPAF